jgi:hypothetical protein
MKVPVKWISAAGTAVSMGLAGFAVTAAIAPATSESAGAVPILRYDIDQVPRSGFGCWSQSYTGARTAAGRRAGSSLACRADGNEIANYVGGSGSLNDGVISTSTAGTHLFVLGNADDGRPIDPVITLHLGGTFVINAIRIFGGEIGVNLIPGALNGVTVEIGGTPVALATIPFGVPNSLGVPRNDLIDLANTALAGIATDRIVLRGFRAALFGSPFDRFSITEITVEGTPTSPEVGIGIGRAHAPS